MNCMQRYVDSETLPRLYVISPKKTGGSDEHFRYHFV